MSELLKLLSSNRTSPPNTQSIIQPDNELKPILTNTTKILEKDEAQTTEESSPAKPSLN
jgi:hypothetical protein